MGNKEDWEKLEEWKRQKDEEKKEKFGESVRKNTKIRPASFWDKVREAIDNSSITVFDIIICIIGIIGVIGAWTGALRSTRC